ncbi:MAG: Hsp20 family protein [Burkholderiales bacterium]|nr:Hsp20 family protein [Burkholderiales bacterium]
MANITRFDPFFDIDDLFRGFRLAPLRRENEMAPKMKLDVEEDDKNYTIHAEIPGAKKDDIKVSIDNNQVSISADIKRESEKKEKGRIVHSERYYGTIYRSFSLDSAVDEGKAKAEYKDGLLELVLPKKNSGGPMRLKVS